LAAPAGSSRGKPPSDFKNIFPIFSEISVIFDHFYAHMHTQTNVVHFRASMHIESSRSQVQIISMIAARSATRRPGKGGKLNKGPLK